MMASLIKYGKFKSHSGLSLSWKIDADALFDSDIVDIAKIIHDRMRFSKVIGIPRGGVRLANALQEYVEIGYPVLIVDDVLTTGRSMEEYRLSISDPIIGVVIFSRGVCPKWVRSVFTVDEWARI